MGISGETQLLHLLYAVGLGCWIGIYYELFRTWRLLNRPTAKSCFFQDVFFCLSSAFITFFVFLAMADGEMPLYLFVGEGLGFLVFNQTLGRVVHRFLAVIVRTASRMLRPLLYGAYRPIKAFLSRIWKKIGNLCIRPLKKMMKSCKKGIFFSKKP